MRLFVDVSDLVSWARCFTRPSGIQRFMIELGRYGLPGDGTFVRLDGGHWLKVGADELRQLCDYFAAGEPDRSGLDRCLLALSGTEPVTMRQGDMLYIPGAFWGEHLAAPAAAAHAAGVRIAAMFYDLIPLRRPDFCPADLVQRFCDELGRIAPALELAQSISRYSAQDVRSYFDERGLPSIPVTAHPLAHEFAPAAAPRDTTVPFDGRRFVLCVGTIDRRKNQRLLISVWRRLIAELGDSCPLLVLAGGAWPQSRTTVVQDVAADPALTRNVVIRTDASDAELQLLYQECLFTVFPSLFEGWGLPVGESLARGKLCVSSAASSMPEIGGDLAVYFDPTDEQAAYEAIAENLRSPDLLAQRTERIRREFRPRPWAEVFAGIFQELEAALSRPVSRAAPRPGRVRLYGHLRGESSFAQVTRGMERALRAAGELAGACSLDCEEEGETTGMDAPLSLNCGEPLGLMTAHRLGSHRAHWLLLAPNSESLPQGLLKSLVRRSEVLKDGLLTGGLLAPSAWAAGVLRRLAPGLPVIVAPHGVTPEVHWLDMQPRESVRAAYRSDRFDVLHMTSSETDRKGTRQLLLAWKRAKETGLLPRASRLLVVMNPLFLSKLRWWCADFGVTEEDVRIAPGFTMGQADVANLYRSMHMICQPSRGEGFGLVPLEALACGVPVIATACTGHSEYLATSPPGAVIVEHGALAQLNDFPGSMAPEVTEGSIRAALGVAYANWERLAAAAEQHAGTLGKEWSWEAKNVPAIRRMLAESERAC